MEQVLLLGIPLDPFEKVCRPSCPPEVRDSLAVHGEETDGRAVFRSHVRDGRAIGQPKRLQSRAEKLDESSDDPESAQDLRHREDEVRCGGTFG